MKLNEIIKDGIYVLKERNIQDCTLKARLLLAYILGKPKEYLMINDSEEISDEKIIEYFSLLDRLIMGEPLQYIINKQEFMGFDFFVNKQVLIPQPDTEILVQAIIKFVNHNLGKENNRIFEIYEKEKMDNIKILDLCTGSGAIAISLYNYLKNEKIKIFASDISKGALEVAKINCKKNNSKINLIHSDMFENINEKFDIVVSNPPYIETDEIKNLSLDVQNEPILALDGGKDGLDFYRKIAKESKNYINKKGMLFLEIGYNQKESVRRILNENNFKNIMCLQDFAGNDRVIIANI